MQKNFYNKYLKNIYFLTFIFLALFISIFLVKYFDFKNKIEFASCNINTSVEKFEKEFANKFCAVDAVAFPYGRSAQWAFLSTIGMKNKKILMPAYTCSVVAHSIVLSGNTPQFIDIDLHDFNMDLDLAEKAIDEKTIKRVQRR